MNAISITLPQGENALFFEGKKQGCVFYTFENKTSKTLRGIRCRKLTLENLEMTIRYSTCIDELQAGQSETLFLRFTMPECCNLVLDNESDNLRAKFEFSYAEPLTRQAYANLPNG